LCDFLAFYFDLSLFIWKLIKLIPSTAFVGVCIGWEQRRVTFVIRKQTLCGREESFLQLDRVMNEKPRRSSSRSGSGFVFLSLFSSNKHSIKMLNLFLFPFRSRTHYYRFLISLLLFDRKQNTQRSIVAFVLAFYVESWEKRGRAE
jgi:hypothetical protein